MSFELCDFTYIVNTIEDILSTSKSSSQVTICSCNGTPTNHQATLKISFPLKNGRTEIVIADNKGELRYRYSNGYSNMLRIIEFDDYNVRNLTSSFQVGLKQILALDRASTVGRAAMVLTNAN